MTFHETGATLEYHGQTVSFEWQLRHERSRIALMSAGTASRVVIALAGSLRGLVRAGRTICMARKMTTAARIRRLNRRPTEVSRAILFAGAAASARRRPQTKKPADPPPRARRLPC